MKTLDKFKQLDTNLANDWIVVHDKTYITHTADLNTQIKRYNRFQMIRYLIATLAAFSIVVFFGYYFLFKIPEQVNGDAIFGLTALASLVWFMVYCFCRAQHPDKVEVFESVRKFARDWKAMKKLEQKGYGFDTHLYQIGDKIAEADRMLDKPKANSLKKKLRKEQKTLLAFGRCREDWGIYIPKQPSTVVMNVDWPKVTN